jgi:hypothetical protein
LTVPQAPAPRDTAVFSLSIRSVAGAPPSRARQAVWQASQDSMSFARDQTTASARLQDSTMCIASRSTASPATTTPGKCAQSTCACAPGGVSTRRRARITGAGYARLQYRCTERRLPP